MLLHFRQHNLQTKTNDHAKVMMSHLSLDDRPLLQYLRNDIVVSVRAKLALELALGGCVEDALRAVPVVFISALQPIDRSEKPREREKRI